MLGSLTLQAGKNEVGCKWGRDFLVYNKFTKQCSLGGYLAVHGPQWFWMDSGWLQMLAKREMQLWEPWVQFLTLPEGI